MINEVIDGLKKSLGLSKLQNEGYLVIAQKECVCELLTFFEKLLHINFLQIL